MKIYQLLLVPAFAIATAAQAQNKEVLYLTKPLTSESVKNVVSETSGGNITVAGVSSDARVEVYVNRNNFKIGSSALTTDEIKQRIDEDYDLDVSVSGGTLTASAKPKHRNMDWKRALSFSFRIYAPQTVSTDLTTSGGNIDLTNLSGNKKFTTSGGNLRLDNLSGNTRGTTSGGNVTVKNSREKIDLSTSGGNVEAVDCEGDLHLSTSGGGLKLERLKGTIDASTSGGNVRGEAIEGSLKAHTSGGNVHLDDLACSVETSTSGGHIDVTIKQLKAPVRIDNSGGNISLKLPKGSAVDLDVRADRIDTDNLPAFRGDVSKNTLRGSINGGGNSVDVNSSSGRVSLSFQ